MDLNNRTRNFWKALDVIGKLSEHEKTILATLMTTVTYDTVGGETTFKVGMIPDLTTK